MSGIQMMVLAAGAGFVVPLPGGTVRSYTVGASNPSVSLTFSPDGTVSSTSNGTLGNTLVSHKWHGSGGAAYIRATLLSGTTPGTGSLGAWLSLASARTWSSSRSGLGGQTTSLKMEIATDAAGANIVTTGTYNFDLNKDA